MVIATLAGMLTGAIMGLVFVMHATLLLAFRPPSVVASRVRSGNPGTTITAATVAALFGWSALAVVVAIFYWLARGAEPSGPGVVPSLPYLISVLFVAAVSAIPLSLLLRDRLRHLWAEYLLFVGLYGFLLPNLVEVLERRLT